MSENKIRQRVDLLKDLIADGRLEATFDQLKEFINELDGIEEEKSEEKSLKNQLIAIRSRFAQNEKKRRLHPQTDDTDFNLILQSLLNLIDDVEKIALTNPTMLKGETVANLTASEEVYTAYMPIEKANLQATDGNDTSENNGCLFAFANKGTNVNIEVKSFNFLRPILGMATVLLIAGAFFFTRPDSTNPADIGGEVIVTPTPTDPGTPPVVDKEPLGKNGTEMGFTANSEVAQMADYLSDPDSPKTKRFSLNSVSFEKNKGRLNKAGKRDLDKIAMLLKEYPDCYLDIYGLMMEDEEASFNGNKEVSLDGHRARQAFDYLKKQGVALRQMSSDGDGILGKRGISVKLTK